VKLSDLQFEKVTKLSKLSKSSPNLYHLFINFCKK